MVGASNLRFGGLESLNPAGLDWLTLCAVDRLHF